MKYFIFLFLGFFLLNSCTDVNQSITIPLEGDIEQKVYLDFSNLSEADQKELDFESMFLGEEVSINLDTTLLFGNQELSGTSGFTDREIKLLNKVSIRILNDVDNKKKEVEFNLNFTDINERNMIMSLIKKALDGDGGNNDNLNSKSANVQDFLFNSFSNYTLDRKLGVLTFVDIELPNEIDPFGGRAEEPTSEELGMIKEVAQGGIVTKIVLPGKVLSVHGTDDYKIMDGNVVEVNMSYFDMLITSTNIGYTIEYDTGVPITDPKLTEEWETEPVAVIARDRSKAPSDAIVLFGKGDASGFRHYDGSEVKWKVGKKELKAEPGTGDIRSKQDFGSCQLHLEWKSPKEPNKKGQDKGNSGVYFAGKYEVQILNSFENRTYSNGQAGAIYKQHIPLVNATSPTGDWNTYDIIYHAPEFDEDGAKTKSGTFTVLHNGVLIQDHVEILGTTEYIGRPKNVAHGHGPIILQEHNNYVSYRNVWIRPL